MRHDIHKNSTESIHQIHSNTHGHACMWRHTQVCSSGFWSFLICSPWEQFLYVHATLKSLQSCAAFVIHHLRLCEPQKSAKQRDIKQELTRQDDHVHSPEDTHDPPNHDDCCQYLDHSRCHVEPKHATNSPLREQLAAGSAQHREG